MSLNGGDDRGAPLLSGGSNRPALPAVPRRLQGKKNTRLSEATKSMGGMSVASEAPKKNQLGTFDGCYIPCILNILGVILFLKLGWGTGTAGVVGMSLIFLFAELLCVLTVLSLSAIVTNGVMPGGGAYYMISRSLGPEFGGAIGMLFYIANAFGASFYFIGFAEGIALFDFVSAFFCENNPEGFCIGATNFNRAAGFVSLIICFVISWVGADAFTRVNIPLFIVQCATVAIGAVSYLVPVVRELGVHNTTVPLCQLQANLTSTCEYVMENVTFHNPVIGFDNATGNFFAQNWAMPMAGSEKEWPFPNAANVAACPATSSQNHPNIYQRCSLLNVFSIIFPAVTGIMVGSNLSGDLKEPGVAIPVGTFWAMLSSYIMYMFLIFTMAYSFSPNTLMYNSGFWQEATWLEGIPIVVGVIVASVSSGLGSLFGGSRILQAMARDDLFPKFLSFINVFGYGSKKGDEPHYALILTAVISLIGVGIADLDSIADMITSFYLLTYSIVNFTCFFLSITGAPNFRPTWKYYSWHTALLGGILNLIVLFATSWIFGLISLAAMAAIFILLQFSDTTKDWGDVSQALVYHQVRKFLLLLDNADKGHSKFWRPSFLVLVDDMSSPYNLLGCLEALKKGGLLVLGGVVIGDLPDMADARLDVRQAWFDVVQKLKLKAFVQIGVAKRVRDAYRLFITCAGLGGLDTNTVVVPLLAAQDEVGDSVEDEDASVNVLPTNNMERTGSYYNHVTTQLSAISGASPRRKAALSSAQQWLGVVKDTIELERNVVVESNFHTMPQDTTLPEGKRFTRGPTDKQAQVFIDVWLNCDTLLRNPGDGAQRLNTGKFMREVFNALREEAEEEKQKGGVVRSVSELRRRTEPDEKTDGGEKVVTEAQWDPEAAEMHPEEEFELTYADNDNDDEMQGHAMLTFKDSSSLTLQLGFILNRSKRWVRHSKHRINFLYRNVPALGFDDEKVEAMVEKKVREFCAMTRVELDEFRVFKVGEDFRRAATFEDRCEAARNIIAANREQTCVSLLPLPSFDHVGEGSEAEAAAYCAGLRTLTNDIGPTLMVKYGERKEVVTNVI